MGADVHLSADRSPLVPRLVIVDAVDLQQACIRSMVPFGYAYDVAVFVDDVSAFSVWAGSAFA